MQNNVVRLLMEKRDALKQIAEVKRNQAKAAPGDVSATDVAAATLAVLEVELELASNRNERIAVLEKMVKEARIFEEVAQADRAAGIADGITVLQSHLKTLDYRIRLEQEKAKKA